MVCFAFSNLGEESIYFPFHLSNFCFENWYWFWLLEIDPENCSMEDLNSHQKTRSEIIH